MFGVVLILIQMSKSLGYGYDSGTDYGACGKPTRSSRMFELPCDLAIQTFCVTAGTSYPWHAVRRFVRENQGLMRRMYGDERHLAVLRAELEPSYEHRTPDFPHDDVVHAQSRFAKHELDLDDDNELHQEYRDENTPRLLRDYADIDDVLNTKFVYSGKPTKSVKVGDLAAPRFRPTTQRAPGNATSNSSASASAHAATDDPVRVTVDTENRTEVFYQVEEEDETSIEDTTDRSTTTEDATTDTTSTGSPEDRTTEYTAKKVSVGALLFQDVVDEKEKTKPIVNYKTQGVNACPVKQEVVAPFWANNTRGEVLALLNLYPFEQYVHWEKCSYEHRQMYCRDGCRCEQQYRLHRLLAYDPNNECRGIFSDWFKFPSCCVCKCYDIPEFRVTSRSPRNKDDKYLPSWFKKKAKQYLYN